MMNFRVPSRVCDAEGGAVCSKNTAFGYFDGTAWTPRFAVSYRANGSRNINT